MEFNSYLKECSAKVDKYFSSLPAYPLFPDELAEGTFCYFLRGGKRLRPAILSLCAALFGGKEKEAAALPCAAALEFYHNYTLIHDDIIDNDATRRGKPSVHSLISQIAEDKYSSSQKRASEYGTCTAILAGDALHSAAIDSITKLIQNGVSPKTVIKIISLLEGNYGLRLISGETIDTKNGMVFEKPDFEKINESEVIEMMSGKTGALFSICAVAGALIGLDSDDESDERITALSEFADNCGIAFQLKDDILGITSDIKSLGKPVLNDIREGKITVLMINTFKNIGAEDKEFMMNTIGSASDEISLLKAKEIIMKSGSIEYTEKLAEKYLANAKENLYKINKNEYRDLLEAWCDFMIGRKV